MYIKIYMMSAHSRDPNTLHVALWHPDLNVSKPTSMSLSLGSTLGFPGEVGQKLQTESLLIPFRGTVVTRSEKATDDDVAFSPTLIPARGKANDGLSGAGMYSVCVTLCGCLFPKKLKQCPLATDRWLLFCESGQLSMVPFSHLV